MKVGKPVKKLVKDELWRNAGEVVMSRVSEPMIVCANRAKSKDTTDTILTHVFNEFCIEVHFCLKSKKETVV